MNKPFEWYVDQYNMVSKSRRHAVYRFTRDSWHSLMQYRKYEIKDAVDKALVQPELDILKRWRFKDIYCRACHVGGMWAGQAISSYTCEACKVERSWPNTGTPRICTACAIHQFKCQRCKKSLDEDMDESVSR